MDETIELLKAIKSTVELSNAKLSGLEERFVKIEEHFAKLEGQVKANHGEIKRMSETCAG